MLNQNLVFENTDLDLAVLRADDHGAVDCLAASQKLRFGDNASTTTGIATVTAALALGLEASRTANLGWLVAWFFRFARCANLYDCVRGYFTRGVFTLTATSAPTEVCLAILARSIDNASALWVNRWGWQIRGLKQQGRRRDGGRSCFGSRSFGLWLASARCWLLLDYDFFDRGSDIGYFFGRFACFWCSSFCRFVLFHHFGVLQAAFWLGHTL